MSVHCSRCLLSCIHLGEHSMVKLSSALLLYITSVSPMTALFCACCAAIIIGLTKKATLPIWEPDRKQLRDHCTKPWVDKDGKKRSPMMTHQTFAQKPIAFFHKYCRHYTPPADVIEKELRKIPTQFQHLSEPSTGALVFREGGPAMRALENLILLVKSGKLSGKLQRQLHSTCIVK